jgi:hypothetical protein
MKFGFRAGVTLLFLLGAYAFGRAQGEKHAIEIGPVTLHVGMSRASTISALSTYYSINDLGMVTTKSGPPYESVGQVVFKNDKLSEVRKNWSPTNQEQGYELANNLYGLFDGFKREGRTACTLETIANQDPSGETKTFQLRCGDKEVRVDAVKWRVEGQIREGAIVSEVLRSDN